MRSGAPRRRLLIESDDEHEEHEEHPVTTHDTSVNLAQQPAAKSASSAKWSVPQAFKSATPSTSPQKPKGKKKGTTKTPPKPSGKPIYSFFNAATQRQQVLPPSATPEKLSTMREEVELIHDDTDDETQDKVPASTTLSQGSSTALAIRKRKFQRTQSFEDEVAIPQAASQKFRKASTGSRVLSPLIKDDDTRPWTERFAPANLSELAVHKRKVADVREWLQATFRGRRHKVLVLKGAAGTGKTTTMYLLAKDLGVQIIEWRDTAVSEYVSDGFSSATARFEEFVRRAGNATGLTLSSDDSRSSNSVGNVENNDPSKTDYPQALLIEEFPNTFSKTSNALQSFRSTIAQYVSTQLLVGALPTPMIMVISETLLSTNTAAADSFTAHRLLGPELITNPYVNIIEFNPVAPTFLIKSLESVLVKEARKSGRRKSPGPQVLKRLAETGDIRSAISSLEFLCLRGDGGDTWSSKISFSKPKRSKPTSPLTKSEEEALKLITNRESSLGIFHSVGKVVYNKRTDPQCTTDVVPPPPWSPHHQRRKLPETDANSLLDELGTDTSTYILALHENYTLSCSCSSSEESLDSLLGCIDNLSDSDLLSLDRFSFGTRAYSGSATDTVRQDEMCFQVAVRGVLFNLPNPVHRGASVSGVNRADAHRMYYPSSLKIWRRKLEVEEKLQLLISKRSRGAAGITTRATAIDNTHTGSQIWRRYQDNADSVGGAKEVDMQSQSSTEVRDEMLMDRLPYMSHILASKRSSVGTQFRLDLVLAVTRISETSLVVDDDAEGEDGYETPSAAEQWSTDRPDTDSGTASRTFKKPIVPRKHNSVFETVSVPVERRVENLVLEDDDIVDD